MPTLPASSVAVTVMWLSPWTSAIAGAVNDGPGTSDAPLPWSLDQVSPTTPVSSLTSPPIAIVSIVVAMPESGVGLVMKTLGAWWSSPSSWKHDSSGP